MKRYAPSHWGRERARWAFGTAVLAVIGACAGATAKRPMGPLGSGGESSAPASAPLPLLRLDSKGSATEPSPQAAKSAIAEAAREIDEEAPSPPRITSVAVITRIYPVAGRMGVPLGYVRVGGSVPLRASAPIKRNDCRGGWYAVEPRGYVCLDGTTVLRGVDKPIPSGAERLLRALEAVEPTAGPLPYGYALSLGAPMYGRIPNSTEQSEEESQLGERPTGPLGRWAAGHDGLTRLHPMEADGWSPWFFEGGEFSPVNVQRRDERLVRKFVPRGSMLSYGSSFRAEGRTWLITPELSIVPADRVRIYRASSFHGLRLEPGTALPMAWTRARPRTKFRRIDHVGLAGTNEAWEARIPIQLTGKRVVQEDRTFLETTEPDIFVAETDVVLVEKSRHRPPAVGPEQKWVLISIAKGTLTAYEGDVPVYTTLVSPGAGGVPEDIYVRTRDLVSAHATPLGVYRIQYKDKFAIMSPDPEQKKYWIADVPYVQYFRGPFALHAAYWHEDFGLLRSGGCVNLSPLDAEWLFGWTDPKVPEAWQGAQASGQNGRGTVVWVVP